jgi:2-methylcitrate dehydratase PrpD
MAQETVRLAEYAAALRYEDLPAEIVRRAKECIADTVAVIICGGTLPSEPDRYPLRRAHRARRQEPYPRQP